MSIDSIESPEQRAARIAAWQGRINESLPPEGLELLSDPRLDGIKERPKGLSPATLTIKPEPVRTESAYLRLHQGVTALPSRSAQWVNPPAKFISSGEDFAAITERPRFEQAAKAPKRLWHFTGYGELYVVSPDLLELFQRFAPDAFVTVPIDWVFSDGQGLAGYVLLDIMRGHHVYDFKRSTVYVEVLEGVRRPRLGVDRALRDDVPADAHLFRDSHEWHEIFVSRALAEQMYQLAHRELDFEDVQRRRRAEFPLQRARRKLLATLKPTEAVEENASMPLSRRMNLRIMPLIQKGAFAEAEATLLTWLAAEPVSPYHVIAHLQITSDPRKCARFFDAFYEEAGADDALACVYTEMNGFTINPDLWFCDAFGFGFHGGLENLDWLGDFGPATDEHFVIDGLEDLQRVFLEYLQSRPDWRQHANARTLTEALVIVKFQRFMQSARSHMKKLGCPLLASAHDHTEFVVEIIN